MRITDSEADNRELLQLMTLLSPVFPVGAFSYSHGLEQAVHDSLVTCREEMEDWLRGLLHRGSAWNDTVLLVQAWRAAAGGAGLAELAQLARALADSREREIETCLQGQAFLRAAADYGVPCSTGEENLAYPLAVGAVAAGLGIGLSAVAAAYLHAFVSNLIQAGLRFVPLGQKDGVRLIHALEGDIVSLSRQAPQRALADLGSAAVTSDICAMRHETLYSRIFRT